MIIQNSDGFTNYVLLVFSLTMFESIYVFPYIKYEFWGYVDDLVFRKIRKSENGKWSRRGVLCTRISIVI